MLSKSSEQPKKKVNVDEPPPVLGTWSRFYSVVIVNTISVYLLLFLFSYWAAR